MRGGEINSSTPLNMKKNNAAKKTDRVTGSFNERMVEMLKDPEEAQAFLEVVLEEYEKDPDPQALMFALRDIAKAQGGIGKLAKTTRVSRPHLYEILASKHSPSLDTALDIFSGLGFRVRLEPIRRQAKKRVAA